MVSCGGADVGGWLVVVLSWLVVVVVMVVVWG